MSAWEGINGGNAASGAAHQFSKGRCALLMDHVTSKRTKYECTEQTAVARGSSFPSTSPATAKLFLTSPTTIFHRKVPHNSQFHVSILQTKLAALMINPERGRGGSRSQENSTLSPLFTASWKCAEPQLPAQHRGSAGHSSCLQLWATQGFSYSVLVALN